MKPGEGYVLVEIPPLIDSIKTKGGLSLYVDTSYNTGQYANINATVIDVPDKINSRSARENKGKLGHFSPDEEMRLKAGDKVFFSYLAITNAKKNYNRGRYWEEDGKRLALLPYASLFFAVRNIPEPQLRGGVDTAERYSSMDKYDEWKKNPIEYVMLNTWLLIEPVGIKQHSETFKNYGTVIIDEERSTSKIAIVADNPFKSSEGIVTACPPGIGLSIGDNVVFQKESDIPVEYELCRTLDKPYWRMQYKDIVAKRNGMGVDLIDNYCLVIRDEAEKKSALNIWPVEPLMGTIVKVGPKVENLIPGQHIFFADDAYTQFPYNGKLGLLIREGSIFMITNGQKIDKL